MANYDVGLLPTDTQLESHLSPQPDDADFDAPPARRSIGVWDIIIAYDREIMALKRTVKALEEELLKWKAIDKRMEQKRKERGQ